MSDETTQVGAGADDDGTAAEPPRQHPQDPAEGASVGETGEEADQPRAHPQDPAEGADDESAS